MTRKEIATLLSRIRAAYPNYKLTDPNGMLDMWELAFGGDDPAKVYRAAREHLNTNKYFPTIADIRKQMCRPSAFDIPVNGLEVHSSAYVITFKDSGCFMCPYCEEDQTDFCKNCKMEGLVHESIGV